MYEAEFAYWVRRQALWAFGLESINATLAGGSLLWFVASEAQSSLLCSPADQGTQQGNCTNRILRSMRRSSVCSKLALPSSSLKLGGVSWEKRSCCPEKGRETNERSFMRLVLSLPSRSGLFFSPCVQTRRTVCPFYENPRIRQNHFV